LYQENLFFMNFLDFVSFYSYIRKKKIKSGMFFGFLFFGLIAVFGFLFFINSADSARIALTPLVFELIAEKGETTEGYVRVMNPSYDDRITVVMEVEDMFPEGEEGRIRLEIPKDERGNFFLSSWVNFEPEAFTLEPREEKAIKFIIDVPDFAEPGGHYAGILARTEAIEGREGVGVGIIQRIASLVLLTVPGEMQEELSLLSFETSKGYYEYGPIDFAIRFENTGTVHLKPEATIIVANFLGQNIAEIPIEARYVLPGSIRIFEAELSQKWFWGGKYTATLTGNYGTTNLPIEPETIVFWAFPWRMGGAMLLFSILGLTFFALTRKRWGVALRILIKGEAGLPKKKNKK